MGRTQVDSRAETLPYSWYADPDVARAEHEHIFRRSWQYVGHLGELDGPGSMFPTHVGGLPLVVVLDNDEELRAFLNVCRHRGTVLVNEPQRRGTIQCPYHAWTYGLDGSLRAAPRSKEEPDFDMDCLGLVPARWARGVRSCSRTRTWTHRHSTSRWATSRRWSPRTASTWTRSASTTGAPYEIKANWKIAIENYLECYHCQLNHPGFVKLIDEQNQLMEVVGLRLSQVPPIHPDAYTDAAPYDVSDSVPTAQYHILFPAMKFNVNPDGPTCRSGRCGRWPPTAPGVGTTASSRRAPTRRGSRTMGVFDNQVGLRGHWPRRGGAAGRSSGALEHGRLITRIEVLIGAFQDMVRTRVR